MYSLQALWTQAREQLHVITLICANKRYSILKVCFTKTIYTLPFAHRHAGSLEVSCGRNCSAALALVSLDTASMLLDFAVL